MPELVGINGVQLKPFNLLPFNMALKCTVPWNFWVHFYIYDYQFERLWKTPERYLKILRRFAGVISPDFSILLDMPVAQQIWNCWRNKVLAHYLQKNGIAVIPNVGWSDAESYAWAFAGIPENSILSVTSQGCMGHDYVCKQSFINGLHELVRRKSPEKIIVYGIFPDEWKCRFSVPIIALPTFSEIHLRKGA